MVLNFCSHTVKCIEQVRTIEPSYREVSDIYDISGVIGLSKNCIQKLSIHKFHSCRMIKPCLEFCCSICLQVSSTEHKNVIISFFSSHFIISLSLQMFKKRKPFFFLEEVRRKENIKTIYFKSNFKLKLIL